MGCCGGSSAPEVILEDPGDEEPSTFSLQKVGMMSSNWNVYKGDEVGDINKKWFLFNFSGGDRHAQNVDLENFNRGQDPSDKNKGEVMYSFIFDSKPTFFQTAPSKIGTMFDRFTPTWMQSTAVTDDPDDESYFQMAGPAFRKQSWEASGGGNDYGHNYILKFKMETEASIQCRKRGLQGDAYKLKIFAKGTAIVDYDWVKGDSSKGHWKKNTKEFVDELAFQLLKVSTGEVIADWVGPGDREEAFAIRMGKNADFAIDSPYFSMNVKGGWTYIKPVIYSKPGNDPIFALLLGYLAAIQYSPAEIKRDFVPNFPHEPPSSGWFS